MIYLKTYEQVQDFYRSNKNHYLVTSEDEKWYFKKRKGSFGGLPFEVNGDWCYEIFPMKELEDNMDLSITFDRDPKEYLKSLENEDRGAYRTHPLIAVSFENYEKYGKYLNIDKRQEGGDEFIGVTQPVSHKVIGMKFKVISFILGLQKDEPLNI